LLDGSPAKRAANIANRPIDGIAHAEPAPWQADLPQHGGQCDRHPQRLFAIIGALHTGRTGNECAPVGHLLGQRAEAICVQT